MQPMDELAVQKTTVWLEPLRVLVQMERFLTRESTQQRLCDKFTLLREVSS